MIEQLKLFADAPLVGRGRPVEPIARHALVEGDYRFWAKRAWGAGPQVAWAMCNPSTADDALDDPTMWRVMEFSNRWGFGSCVVVNVYPVRSSWPSDMRVWRKGLDLGLPHQPHQEWFAWQQNIKIAAAMLTGAQARIAAWGGAVDMQDLAYWLEGIHIERADLAGIAVEAFGECSVMDIGVAIRDWLCLGTINSGAPLHPLARGIHRVPSDAKPVPWTWQN